MANGTPRVPLWLCDLAGDVIETHLQQRRFPTFPPLGYTTVRLDAGVAAAPAPLRPTRMPQDRRARPRPYHTPPQFDPPRAAYRFQTRWVPRPPLAGMMSWFARDKSVPRLAASVRWASIGETVVRSSSVAVTALPVLGPVGQSHRPGTWPPDERERQFQRAESADSALSATKTKRAGETLPSVSSSATRCT